MTEGAFHGGASFDAIGAGFRTLERSRDVISADVLDAWFPPSPRIVETLREYLPFLLMTSPPTHAEGLTAAIAEARDVPPEFILTGSGSSSLIFGCLPRLIPSRSSVLMLDPCYGEYEHVCANLLDAHVVLHQLSPAKNFQIQTGDLIEHSRLSRPDAVLLVNPNSPTGVHWPRDQFLEWMRRVPPSTLVWLDETYIDFAGSEHSLERDVARLPNLVVLKSMSKAYALSGLRIGYLIAQPAVLDLVARFQPPWPVALPAQVAAVEALRDTGYYRARWTETHRLREDAVARLKGVKAFPSDANFYLVELPDPARTAARLREKNIFVREFPSLPLLRIAVKDADQNARIIAAL